MEQQKSWYTIPTGNIFQETDSSEKGLSQQSIEERQTTFGKNELTARKKLSPFLIFLRQFLNVMVLVLLVAAGISVFLGELSDTIIILVILVLNAVIGFIQEYRAEKAMEALQNLSAPKTRVIREAGEQLIPSIELVPGDIVLLEAGNSAPADIRLVVVDALKVSEASLTGESAGVDKSTEAMSGENIPLGDQVNMVFKGTQITSGKGRGVVVATGMKTELGKIAGMLDDAESSTPLQKRLDSFSRKLTVVVLILCIALIGMGLMRGEAWDDLLLTALSLAVAAIPEALPAVVTVSLALGARRLMKKEVLIRKLYAVEALGSVTFICTDKTGTLTKNQMEVKEVWTATDDERDKLLQAMRLNHDAKQEDGVWVGDPTETAMLEYAKDAEALELVADIPFDSERKAMTTIHQQGDDHWMITKGASESIMKMLGDHVKEDEIRKEEERMASQGMRVIAFAGKQLNELPQKPVADKIEKDLEFLGLVGLVDPPRPEAKAAIAECKKAGIKTVMITGDHPLTAAAIGRELGIIESEGEVLEGKNIDKETLKDKVRTIRVYARVSPEQKLTIVEALQANNEFVSMTGDGVNDAPSLKKANIGVAMGITGTDVTKEAAGMILLDDNFATIVRAVREGRRVYDNIRKFIRYILTGNSAEIIVIVGAPLLGLPIPLLPVHILWINLITDGLPALALAVEPTEKLTMERPPRPPSESILARGLGFHVLWVGLFIAILSIGMQWYAIDHMGSHWQTMIFTVLCFCQLWHVMAIRSEQRSLFRLGLLSNKPLLGAVLGTVLLQLAVIYLPAFNQFFHTEPLSFGELMIAIGISSLVFVAVEIEKAVKRSSARTTNNKKE